MSFHLWSYVKGISDHCHLFALFFVCSNLLSFKNIALNFVVPERSQTSSNNILAVWNQVFYLVWTDLRDHTSILIKLAVRNSEIILTVNIYIFFRETFFPLGKLP